MQTAENIVPTKKKRRRHGKNDATFKHTHKSVNAVKNTEESLSQEQNCQAM